MSYKSGQLGMLAVKVAVCKAFFSPFIIVFEPRPPAPKAQVSRDMQMLGVTLTHPLVSQCTLTLCLLPQVRNLVKYPVAVVAQGMCK